MNQEKGEIQKRLEKNLCPWCMNKLELISEEYRGGSRVITRKCVHCKGEVSDHFTHEGTDNGDDTRS